MTEITIGGRPVGPAHKPFIIAEMSGNHNQSLERALALVDAAAAAGVDALKLQTYTADTITIDVDKPEFRLSSGHALWGDRRLYDLYEEAHTPWEWHEPIFALARELGMAAFSSPFDPTSVDFLDDLDREDGGILGWLTGPGGVAPTTIASLERLFVDPRLPHLGGIRPNQ